MKNLGAGSVIVRTETGIKMFSQGEIDKRGIRIYKDGRLVQLSDLHEGDKLTASFVTEGPPEVLTEKRGLRRREAPRQPGEGPHG
jgi:hypothetical protein